jgi:hypothetical protein
VGHSSGQCLFVLTHANWDHWAKCGWASAVLLGTNLSLCLALPPATLPACCRRPCILIGSAFGALLGLLLLEVVPPSMEIQPGVYAIVCATAMLGAVFRSSISLVVIVVEGTRGIGKPGRCTCTHLHLQQLQCWCQGRDCQVWLCVHIQPKQLLTPMCACLLPQSSCLVSFWQQSLQTGSLTTCTQMESTKPS